MYWWKVTVDAQGKKIAVEKVARADPEPSGNRVYYIRRATEALAIAAAFERYKEDQRRLLKERRKRHMDNGRCPCGGERKLNPKNGTLFKHCQRCIDTVATSKARKQARDAGIELAPLPPKSVALAENRARKDNEIRLEVFQEVHRAWCRSKSTQAFTAWILAQIKALEGKVAA